MLYIGQFELLLYIIYCNSYFSKVIVVGTHSLESWQNIIRFTRSCVITLWASIEVFNNVHTRLGGLDTIMNSSGSVGNLDKMISWTWSNTVRPNCCSHCTKSFGSAGKKELYLRTWGTPRSLPYTKTRARGTTVTTTGAPPYAALSAKYLLGSYWYASSSWRSVSARSHNEAPVLNAQQYKLSSPFDSYKRNAENIICPCTSVSLISLRRLI